MQQGISALVNHGPRKRRRGVDPYRSYIEDRHRNRNVRRDELRLRRSHFRGDICVEKTA